MSGSAWTLDIDELCQGAAEAVRGIPELEYGADMYRMVIEALLLQMNNETEFLLGVVWAFSQLQLQGYAVSDQPIDQRYYVYANAFAMMATALSKWTPTLNLDDIEVMDPEGKLDE